MTISIDKLLNYNSRHRWIRCKSCNEEFDEDQGMLLIDRYGRLHGSVFCPFCGSYNLRVCVDPRCSPIYLEYIDGTMQDWEIRRYRWWADLREDAGNYSKGGYIVHFHFEPDESEMYEGTYDDIMNIINHKLKNA